MNEENKIETDPSSESPQSQTADTVTIREAHLNDVITAFDFLAETLELYPESVSADCRTWIQEKRTDYPL